MKEYRANTHKNRAITHKQNNYLFLIFVE